MLRRTEAAVSDDGRYKTPGHRDARTHINHHDITSCRRVGMRRCVNGGAWAVQAIETTCADARQRAACIRGCRVGRQAMNDAAVACISRLQRRRAVAEEQEDGLDRSEASALWVNPAWGMCMQPKGRVGATLHLGRRTARVAWQRSGKYVGYAGRSGSRCWLTEVRAEAGKSAGGTLRLDIRGLEPNKPGQVWGA